MPEKPDQSPQDKAAYGAPNGHSEVYLLRGLFDVFSLGMDEIGRILRAKGVHAAVHSGPSWPYLGQRIHQHREQAGSPGALVISGHSYGADDAIRLASSLDESGVRVDALVLVDPTTPPKIPANVSLCVNIYRSNPTTDWMPWLRGVPVEKESNATRIVNHDLRLSASESALAGEVNHFNIEEHPQIQEMVVGEILNIIQQTRTGSKRLVSGLTDVDE